MNETSKCHDKRIKNGHFEKYLRGSGIDIGCGPDPLRVQDGTVLQYDKLLGNNADRLDDLENQEFDFIYSSHCLEHLQNPYISLIYWSTFLKPFGYMYLVVPDWELYEKRIWPSRFNRDHKWTFSLTERNVRTNHIYIPDLNYMMESLGFTLIETLIESDNYNFSDSKTDQTLGNALSQICVIYKKGE